ncbi:MAG: hypothetical protein IMZ57_13490 [Acidobacteria bacterium]|nr:hypothetical protein [Acidobacteriota bacterium]
MSDDLKAAREKVEAADKAVTETYQERQVAYRAYAEAHVAWTNAMETEMILGLELAALESAANRTE